MTIAVPPPVSRVIQQYRKNNEKYDVLPCRVRHEDHVYYYVHYNRSDKYLVVREDGAVPPFSEVQPVIEMSARFVGLHDLFMTFGNEKAKNKNLVIDFRRLSRVLNWFDRKYRRRLSPDAVQLLERFQQVAEEVLASQERIVNVVEKAKQLLRQLKEREEISNEDIQQLRSYHVEFLKCGLRQNDVQLESYEDRKRFLRHLALQIPPWRLVSWFLLWELLIHHWWMYNQLDRANALAREEVIDKIRGIPTKDDERKIKEIFASTINPKREVNFFTN